jgi:hypothetical protein
MPVCLACRKSTNCLSIDPCDHCGAKNWDEKTVLKAQGESTPSWIGKLIGGLVSSVFTIILFLAGLWLLVFVVKWMWQHS